MEEPIEAELGRIDRRNVLLDEANVVRRNVRVADVVAPLPGPAAQGAGGGADGPAWLPGLLLALQQANLAKARELERINRENRAEDGRLNERDGRPENREKGEQLGKPRR